MSGPLDSIYPEFFAGLRDYKLMGPEKATALCPAHEDGRHSLSIGLKSNGDLLFNCHAGCGFGEILRSIGVKPYQIRNPDTRREAVSEYEDRGKPVATYNYRDEKGELLYKIERRLNMQGEKYFVPYHQEDGKWVKGLGEVRRVLYNLPELIARPTETVFLVEGEKDADNLAALGFLATTNPSGASTWRSEYAEMLRDRDVVIIPDNDEAGKDAVSRRGNTLQFVAKTLRVLELPGLAEKGDVSDWIEQGNGLEDLKIAVKQSAVEFDPEIHAQKTKQEVLQNETEIANFDKFKVQAANESKVEKRPRPMSKIGESIFANCDGWPKRVGGSLFAVNQSEVQWFEKHSSLFGWIGLQSGCPPKFARGGEYHSKDEVFGHIQRASEQFESVEKLPHFPAIAGRYYLSSVIEPGNGQHLDELVSRFSPTTSIDGDLIRALFVTPGWGGPPGSRPAFVITSDAGRGSGKTTLAKMVEIIWGGKIDVTARESIEILKQRLLTPECLTKRIAVLDNLKSTRFSNSDFEGLITSPSINGKRLYHGDASRPNDLTWIITGNGVSLSTDIAQRSVFIEIDRPRYSGDWEESLVDFITTNRNAILSDIAGFFMTERKTLSRYSRWSRWEREVVERLPDPAETQAITLQRQAGSDVENEESEFLREKFLAELTEIKEIDPKLDRVFISAKLAAEWISEVTKDRGTSLVAASRLLRQKIRAGEISELSEGRQPGTGARGFMWQCDTLSTANVVDAETSIAYQNGKERYMRGF